MRDVLKFGGGARSPLNSGEMPTDVAKNTLTPATEVNSESPEAALESEETSEEAAHGVEEEGTHVEGKQEEVFCLPTRQMLLLTSPPRPLW